MVRGSDLELDRDLDLESLESLEGLDRDSFCESLDRDLSLPEAADSRLIAGRESKLAAELISAPSCQQSQKAAP